MNGFLQVSQRSHLCRGLMGRILVGTFEKVLFTFRCCWLLQLSTTFLDTRKEEQNRALISIIWKMKCLLMKGFWFYLWHSTSLCRYFFILKINKSSVTVFPLFFRGVEAKEGQKWWKLNYHWEFVYLLVWPQVEFIENDLFLMSLLEEEYSFPFKVLSVLL